MTKVGEVRTTNEGPRYSRQSKPWHSAIAAIATAVLAGANSASAGEALIIVAGPGSGPQAEVTKTIAETAEGFAMSLNDHGGLIGNTVRVERVEDGCEAGQAEAAAKAIAARQPALVLGHPCTRAALAAAKVYGAAKILYIASTVRQPELTSPRAGPTIFRTAGRDDRQGEAAAQILAERAAGGRILLVTDRTRYSRTLVEQTQKSLAALGVKSVSIEGIIAGEKEFPAFMASLRGETAPAAVFFTSYGIESGLIIKATRREGNGAFVLLADIVTVDGEIPVDIETARAGPICFLGALAKSSDLLSSTSSPMAATAATDHGSAPTTEVMARTMMSLEAVTSAATPDYGAGSIDPTTLATRLTAGVTTRFSLLAFDANGDLRRPSYAAHCFDGKEWRIDPRILGGVIADGLTAPGSRPDTRP
jgi:branched-chain amino acid transport system substrate-binding protein